MILSKSRYLLLTGLLLGALLGIQGQDPVPVERSSNKVILEGKVYYIHVVEPGQTLFSISRAYSISEKEIAVENPGVISGIRVGQALKIPVEPSLEVQIDTSEPDTEDRGKNTHRVSRGETLFGIARKYGLSETELREANSNVRPEDLKPGMRLVIPKVKEAEVVVEKEESVEPAFNEEGLAYHKVRRKETLYSIARFYGTTVDDIRAANPELGWGGPKTGQVIRVPLPTVADQPDSARDTLAADTLGRMYSEEMDGYYYDELLSSHDNKRRVYRIAYLIPFSFTEAVPLDSLLKDVESATRRARITERYRMEQKVPQAVPFLEFFQGSLLALDSLRQTGMRMDIRYYDTKRSMARTREILEMEGMDDMDLIIGPFYDFNLELVSDFARKEKIPVVTPFYNEHTYIWDNPYLFQPSPTLEKGYRQLAKLVASKHDYNIVYVREEDSMNIEKHRFLQDLIFDGFDDYRPAEPVVFKEMVLTLEHSDELIHSLSSEKKNLVVVPTRNEALASRVVSSLFYRQKDFEIEVVGTPFWTEFSSITYRYYHQLGLVFYNPFWMDHLDSGVDAFLRRYRDHFYAEPTAMTRKGINYGIAGFDMTMYFASALKIYGRRFILSLDEYDPPMVLQPYSFSRISNGGGYENTQTTFYQFQPDMTIREIQVPEPPEPDFWFRRLEDDRKSTFLIEDSDID